MSRTETSPARRLATETRALLRANARRLSALKKITDIYDGAPPFTARWLREHRAENLYNVNWRTLENVIDNEAAVAMKRMAGARQPWRLLCPDAPPALVDAVARKTNEVASKTGDLCWSLIVYRTMHSAILTGATAVYWPFLDLTIPATCGPRDIALPADSRLPVQRIAIRGYRTLASLNEARDRGIGEWNKTLAAALNDAVETAVKLNVGGTVPDEREASRAYYGEPAGTFEVPLVFYYSQRNNALEVGVMIDQSRLSFNIPDSDNSVLLYYILRDTDISDHVSVITYAPPVDTVLGVKGLGHRIASFCDAENILLNKCLTGLEMRMLPVYEVPGTEGASQINVQSRGMATVITGVSQSAKFSAQMSNVAPVGDLLTAVDRLRAMRLEARQYTASGEERRNPLETRNAKASGYRTENETGENTFDHWWVTQMEAVANTIFRRLKTASSDDPLRQAVKEAEIEVGLEGAQSHKLGWRVKLVTAWTYADKSRILQRASDILAIAASSGDLGRQTATKAVLAALTDEDFAETLMPSAIFPATQHQALANIVCELIVAGGTIPAFDPGDPLVFAEAGLARFVKAVRDDIPGNALPLEQAVRTLPGLLALIQANLERASQLPAFKARVQELSETFKQAIEAYKQLAAQYQEQRQQQEAAQQEALQQQMAAAQQAAQDAYQEKLMKLQQEYDLKLRELEAKIAINRANQESIIAERRRKTDMTMKMKEELHNQKLRLEREKAGENEPPTEEAGQIVETEPTMPGAATLDFSWMEGVANDNRTAEL